MIDFESELKEILKDDPLGILKNRTVQPITADQRLKDSFEEINKFINIDELHIDLIDKVNPFQKAFEVLSKNVTTRLLKVISETIESQRIVMTDEEAVMLYKKIGDFINKHNREPKLNSNEPLERRMAEAIVFLKNKQRNKSN